MLTDHHCHLQDSKIFPHLDEVLSKAKKEGVFRFICCGTKESDWQQVLELSKKYIEIIPAIGIHPWFVEETSGNWWQNLETILIENPDCLVGEIGLDLHFCPNTIEKQQKIFIQQLEIAKKYQRAVSIHNLKTWHLLIPILQNYPSLKIMLHSFWASPEIIEQLSDLNVFFSLSGSILERSKKKVAKVLSRIPMKKILLETDSPFLLPRYEKITNQKYNEPANLILVLEKISEILKIDSEFLKKQLIINSENFLESPLNTKV